MVFGRENPKMDDFLGYPHLWNPPIFQDLDISKDYGFLSIDRPMTYVVGVCGL